MVDSNVPTPTPARPVERGDLAKLRATVAAYCTPEATALIERAYAFAAAAHAGKQRCSGDPYIIHPIGAAQQLAEMRLDATIIAAGLLHDVVEDAGIPIARVRERFGEDIAFLVDGVTKIGTVRLHGEQRYIENLRKMFVAMAQDIRVIIIKFCDRIHNLETLTYVPEHKRLRIAQESLEIHAPIANRLGMMEIKTQLEDLAFPFIAPDDAAWVNTLIAETYDERRAQCTALRTTLTELLTQGGIRIIGTSARMKGKYSLYKKLQLHERDITRIYDIVALRVIIEDITTCYAVLSAIHQHWKPVRGRIKDYIANPKMNGYHSIHTTVVTDDGAYVEFQIRTPQMHEEAEWGAAAAWRYHERGTYHAPNKQVAWVDSLIHWQRSVDDPHDFLAGLKTEVFRDRILLFTPRGDVIDLPEGATPLDFAYQIHTDVGNRTIGARVNGHAALHPLDRPLNSGDIVEIITDPKRKGPSQDWLHIVRTTHARSKIKEALRVQLRHHAAR
ncbi:MAG: RelA/SpoT family protein [bacterium]|nr:RelA/SpoT family protein [bacterium]